MLKIAEYNTITGERIDLKELEKYGFIFKCNLCWKPRKKDKMMVNISINLDNREINCSGVLGANEKLDDLYDLIKDGLVVKEN